MCIINEGRKNMNRNKTLEFAELLLNNNLFKQLSIKNNRNFFLQLLDKK